MAAHESEVVERETLVSVLWPKVIVNENSLTRAVSELRKQLSTATGKEMVYIETIPKRGYRLRLPVEKVSDDKARSHQSIESFSFANKLPYFDDAKHSVAAALCLSLVLGTWLQFQSPTELNSASTAQWSDELVLTSANAELRDEVLLSSSEMFDLENKDVTPAVFSANESQFAYIQYDHTGSTLYLGQVNSDFEPVPVFNSTDILYNLAWSPVGNALLFASKPALTAALFDNDNVKTAELFSFDLESFRLSKLVEKAPSHKSLSDPSALSLT